VTEAEAGPPPRPPTLEQELHLYDSANRTVLPVDKKGNLAMNYAVIDLGSNSIRLSVYEHSDDKTHKILNRKEILGLAGYVAKGALEQAGIQKACEAVNGFRETASQFVDPSNIRLFATASLRNVKNRKEAAAIIAEKTQLIPDILDGEEEAALGFAGIAEFISCDSGIMIDIGGASTELVLFEGKKAVKLISLPIGCLNLSLAYVHEIIPNAREMTRIKSEIRKQLAKIDWGKDVKCPQMVGIGGTLRAALKLSRAIFGLAADRDDVEARHIKKMSKLLDDKEPNIYQTVYKVVPERLLTVSPGFAILRQAIKKFGCETVSVSKYGVREGYLAERVLKANGKSDIGEGIDAG
jgi:exopolyphosphatase/guanosine-5'-triphosphate,3'-diphosphate pyrophosphatase